MENINHQEDPQNNGAGNPYQRILDIQPMRRGNVHWYMRCGILGLGTAIQLAMNPGQKLVWKFVEVLSALGVGELLHRGSFLSEELHPTHLKTRYDKGKWEVFQRLYGSGWELLLFGASIVLPFFNQETNWSNFCTIVLARLFISLTNWEKNPFVVYREIGGKHSGLFYGISMAYSYFHGYLDIILPDHGHEGEKQFEERFDEAIDESNSNKDDKEVEKKEDKRKHFQERIDEYMDENHLNNENVPDKRLYILIPASGEAPTDICYNAHDPGQQESWMEMCKKLTSVIRNRGGTGQRDYHNQMYKIKDYVSGGVRKYVAAEYATPLITYHEACNHINSDDSWRTFRRDTVISFYETLQDILKKSPALDKKVELIYFEDRDMDRDVNVARVLLDRLNKEAMRRQVLQIN